MKPFEQFLLDSLLATCDHYLGRLSRDQYLARIEKAEQQAPPSLAKQLRVDRLRKSHFLSSDPSARDAVHSELQTALDELANDDEITEALKLQIDLIRQYARAAHAQSSWFWAITQPQMRSSAGLSPITASVAEAIELANAEVSAVQKAAVALHEQAIQLGHPALIAEAIIVKLVPEVLRLSNHILLGRTQAVQPITIPDAIFAGVLAELRTADKLLEAVGAIEGRVRVQLFIAHWLDANDKQNEAIVQAKETLAIAQAMAYDRHEQDAKDMIAGRSTFRRFLSEVVNLPDFDIHLSKATPEDLRRHSLEMLEVMDLPQERLPVVERANAANFRCACERVNWCRHFNLKEDDSHYARKVTRYATDPNWGVQCAHWRHHSYTFSTDIEAVIGWFKNVYCSTCDVRSPKQPPEQSSVS